MITRTDPVIILELQLTQIASIDSIDYVGNLVYVNGVLDKYLFSGGYAQGEGNEGLCIARPILISDLLEEELTQEELERYMQLQEQWSAALEAARNSDTFSFRYYNQDHLGNNREVVDEAGNILQVTNYYPFGTPYCDGVSTINPDTQPFKYNGKELDMMHGMDTYDYGARQYNSILSTWDRVDPLAEKYYHISPYVYCMNNPVNAIDPDGKIIVFANGTSESFKQKYFSAISLLNEKNCNYFLSEIARDPIVILYIAETSEESSYFRYVDGVNTIYWNPNIGLSTTKAVDLSPTTILNHEADHAYGGIYNFEQWKKDCDEKINTNGDKNPYGNKEEERVITGSEQKTARALGEIEGEQVTRNDHVGFSFKALTPTSNKQNYEKNNNTSLDGIIVTYKKKDKYEK